MWCCGRGAVCSSQECDLPFKSIAQTDALDQELWHLRIVAGVSFNDSTIGLVCNLLTRREMRRYSTAALRRTSYSNGFSLNAQPIIVWSNVGPTSHFGNTDRAAQCLHEKSSLSCLFKKWAPTGHESNVTFSGRLGRTRSLRNSSGSQITRLTAGCDMCHRDGTGL